MSVQKKSGSVCLRLRFQAKCGPVFVVSGQDFWWLSQWALCVLLGQGIEGCRAVRAHSGWGIHPEGSSVFHNDAPHASCCIPFKFIVMFMRFLII